MEATTANRRGQTALNIERTLGRPLKQRRDFLARIRSAVTGGSPLAAGRLSNSATYWLLYPFVLGRGLPRVVREAYQRRLLFEACNQCGLFPRDPAYLVQFAEFYADHLKRLDVVGLTLDAEARDLEFFEHYELRGDLMDYSTMKPDRSLRADDRNCYLPSFAGKRVLLVCPFAGLLAERATRETFEGVWSKIGKRWFNPARVEALEFPYGLDPETERRYGNAEALFDDIATQMARRDFDVALIAASGLAVPLASAASQMGKIGLDLGGELQVTFGVLGERYRRREDFMRRFVSQSWIDMPARYRPAIQRSADTVDFW